VSCVVTFNPVCLWAERESYDSDNLIEAARSDGTQLQQPASSAFVISKGVDSGNGNQHNGVCRNASTGDLGGHVDVTGSSAVLPVRSISSSGALYTRMRSQPTTIAEDGGGEESTASEGDLLNCLLRVAGTTTGGVGADGSGLALRRRRRSNAAELDAVVRERTSSPVCFVGDLGQRTAGRRRSLPTPRLTVRDVAVASCTARTSRETEDLPKSTTCSEMQSFSNTAADSVIAGVRIKDKCLSDIDENVASTTSSTSAVPDISQTTNNSTTDSVIDNGEISVVDKYIADNISLIRDQEVVGNTTNERQSVEQTFTSARAVDSKEVDAVQRDVSSVSCGSPTDLVLRQARSTADVDVSETRSSTWLPRRSQSLRLYRLRDHSADVESQQLDINVHEFQTRAAPEREALRNRLRKLSLIYASTADSDETSRTWPASRRPCEDGHTTPTTAPGIARRCGDDVISASSSTSTLQLKYDTDSLSSQRDEGFETASISSDVYLSSSQRSSMCDCDAALTTMSALERRTDPTTTKTTDGASELQPEILPPPPASFLSEPEVVDADTPRSSSESSTRTTESFVISQSEQHPSSNISLSIVNTALVAEKRLREANTESSRGGPPESVKNAAGVRRTAQTVSTPQTKPTARPAPSTPRRGSSLVSSSSASRNAGSTRATAAVTNNHAAGRAVPATVRPSVQHSSASVATSLTSGRHAAFQRSSPLRATDDRKLTMSGRGAAPQTSSAFVRQSQTRATIAAPVLRTNKRAAAEARKLKAATASTTTSPTGNNQSGVSSSSRQTTTTTSASGSIVARSQRDRNRTSSSGSCSSTTSASAAPKLSSFRAVSSGTTTTLRQPTASRNVPCASSKKPDGVAASSSLSLKMPSNLRHSTQPPNSRLRAPVATKKHCS